MDYSGNTDRDKDARQEKKIAKVVTGEVIKRQPSVGRKFKNVFFGGDIKTSAKFVAADVLLPAFRNLILDAIENGARSYILGESRYRRRDPEYRPTISYNNPVRRPNDTSLRYSRARYLPDQPHPYRGPERISRDDIILAKKEDAEIVVERLIDIIDKYEVASVADLYDLIGDPSSPIDNKWGWTSLANVDIRQVRDGYFIDLPALEAI